MTIAYVVNSFVFYRAVGFVIARWSPIQRRVPTPLRRAFYFETPSPETRTCNVAHADAGCCWCV